MSARRVVLLVVFVVLLVVATGLALAAVFAGGVWQDLWLNLLAEVAGAALIVFVVDQLFERSKEHQRDERRRAAIEDLSLVLRELQGWLARLFLQSEAGVAHRRETGDADRVPVETLLDGLPRALGTVDFAASGAYPRDRYFIEWARRSFEDTVGELARWEWSFAGSTGLFGDDFRAGAEKLRSFVRATRSFLEGMERYILREEPSVPVFAYEGVTELTEEGAGRLESELRDFLDFYRDQCRRYDTGVPDLAVIFEYTAAEPG
jgi:hypothetical protein